MITITFNTTTILVSIFIILVICMLVSGTILYISGKNNGTAEAECTGFILLSLGIFFVVLLLGLGAFIAL